jgi:hypothetical protein
VQNKERAILSDEACWKTKNHGLITICHIVTEGGDNMSLSPELERSLCNFGTYCHGVRIIPLQKVILFLFLAKERIKSIDWIEWKSRNPEMRNNLTRCLEAYLGQRDMIEVKYYVKTLGWSPRTVFDYWETVWLLYTFTH